MGAIMKTQNRKTGKAEFLTFGTIDQASRALIKVSKLFKTMKFDIENKGGSYHVIKVS